MPYKTLLSRKDMTGVAVEPYDSIKWAYEVHLKTEDPGPEVYDLAILTGNEDAPNMIEFFAPGALCDAKPSFVWKPFDRDALLDELHNLISDLEDRDLASLVERLKAQLQQKGE